MQLKDSACVHLHPSLRHVRVSWGAGRVSPAAGCAAVIGEGNQLNLRAGGQATRQARHTRLNEWETINNFREAVVNKVLALKVEVLLAVGKGEGGKAGALRRGMGRDGGPQA